MKQSLFNLALVIGIAICLNVIGSYFSSYIDLTEEKRFTLTKPTQQLIKELDDVVYVKVLLEGEFPAGFKRLQKSTRDMLDDFRNISGFIEYEFDNPLPKDLPVEEANARIKQLQKDGILAKNLTIKDRNEQKNLRFYPYAIFTYKDRQIPVDLVGEDVAGLSPEETLNNAIGLLEYKFANAIQKLQTARKPVVAFTQGHGELPYQNTQDIRKELSTFYDVGDLILDSLVQIDAGISVLIVAKPRTSFSEKDKFKIDQYVMNGGNVLWLIDALDVHLDSLASTGQYTPYPPTDDLYNLADLLFKYGARVYNSLVLDLQNTRIPQVIDTRGTQQLFPWYYHLVSIPNQENPITKSLGPVNLLFANTVDTVRTKTSVKKTILLTSSQRSRVQLFPMRLNFEILKVKPDAAKFDKPFQPLAVLLEGEFQSLYENRPKDGALEAYRQLGIEYKSTSIPAKMLVVADGDIISNYADPASKRFAPLGYNPYEKYTFSNKDFIINAIEYMVDDNGVIDARSKEVKLRLLDETKAETEATYWQLFNIILPLLFLILFGIAYNYWRKWRYAS